MEIQKPLPNATATLVLGICSILFGCFLIGLVLGIIGLSLSSSGHRLYHRNPDEYSGFGILNAGRIMSIIGIVLSSISILYYIVAVLIIGAAGLPWLWFLNS